MTIKIAVFKLVQSQGPHLRLVDMSAFGASQGPVLESGSRWRNALGRRATLTLRAAGSRWRSRDLRCRHG